jgi:hypothetical protein
MTPATSSCERPGSAKVTYALALFDEASELVHAVRDLVGHGIACGRISLLATDRDLISQLGCSGDENVMQALPIQASVDGTRHAAACPGWFDELLVAAGEPGPRGFAATTRSLPLPMPQMRSVAEHLSWGGGAVVVRLEDGDEQVSVCETLLAHSRRGVQTHEIRLPR